MASEADDQAELRRLREENEALRYASVKFGELSERLAARVRELEQRVEFYRRLCAAQPAARLNTPNRRRPTVEQVL
jgi:predicted Zn-dependent protease